jgi:mannan endo-1,4-beta-mannosidase
LAACILEFKNPQLMNKYIWKMKVNNLNAGRIYTAILIVLSFTLKLFTYTGCSNTVEQIKLVDQNATETTRTLYRNLRQLQGKALLFGHQATLEYGYNWTLNDIGAGEHRSDVKDVSGSFPSVYGFDVTSVVNHSWTEEERFTAIERQLAFERGIFRRGGVITYEWHMHHPSDGSSFYNTTPVVHRIIPGGDLHDKFRISLDHAAEYFNLLGEIPILFRPWHEHNGDWFWWCKGSTSEEDFISLWRFTVDYLKNEKKVHNLIYVYSPDRSRIDMNDFEAGYLWGYPGDDYVDVFGIDNYWDVGHPGNKASAEEQSATFRKSLEYLVKLADSRGKISALTETGSEKIPDPRWFTDVILDAILHNEYTRRISWFLVWRNANHVREGRDHYYAPFPGHPAAENFIEFKNHPFVWFEDELPCLYHQNL